MGFTLLLRQARTIVQPATAGRLLQLKADYRHWFRSLY
jgi:hypothetical protein